MSRPWPHAEVHLTDMNQFRRAFPDNLDAKEVFACRISHHLQ